MPRHRRRDDHDPTPMRARAPRGGPRALRASAGPSSSRLQSLLHRRVRGRRQPLLRAEDLLLPSLVHPQAIRWRTLSGGTCGRKGKRLERCSHVRQLVTRTGQAGPGPDGLLRRLRPQRHFLGRWSEQAQTKNLKPAFLISRSQHTFFDNPLMTTLAANKQEAPIAVEDTKVRRRLAPVEGFAP